MANNYINRKAELFDRLDSLANIKEQEALKVLIRSLSVEWLNDGADEKNILDYIDYLTRMELRKI